MRLRLLTAFVRLALLRAASQAGGDGTFNTLIVDRALFANGSAPSPSISFINDTDTGIYLIGVNGTIGFATGGANTFSMRNASTAGLQLSNVLPISWAATPSGGAGNLMLYRDANDAFGQRNTTNPQAHRVYNTFTDLANHERAVTDWQSSGGTILSLGTEAAGSGVDRSMRVNTGTGFNSRLVTGSTSMTARDFSFMCSTATAPLTVLLISGPVPGQIVNAKKISTDANRLTIDGNGNLIDGLTTASTIAQTRPNFQLQFGSTSGGGNAWHIL